MRFVARLTAFVAASLVGLSASASDPIGIYAVIDKVVVEPADGTPERVQIWGAFARAKERKGNEYTTPVRGCMYFRLSDEKPDVCRKEWKDLLAVADKGEIVGFGSRYKPQGRVRRGIEKGEAADVYQLGFGVTKLRRTVQDISVRSLLWLPAPIAPSESDPVAPGRVNLVATNVRDAERQRARYVFEIESKSGEREASEPIPAGERETTWSPKLEIRAAETYTWRVHATDGNWNGPTVSSTFVGRGRSDSDKPKSDPAGK